MVAIRDLTEKQARVRIRLEIAVFKGILCRPEPRNPWPSWDVSSPPVPAGASPRQQGL
jgi:hypothetical protein